MNKVYLSAIFALFWLVCSCSNQKTQPDVTPWGTPIGEEDYSNNSNQTKGFTYDDIVSNGELIMLTVNGPDTYYIRTGIWVCNIFFARNLPRKLGSA